MSEENKTPVPVSTTPVTDQKALGDLVNFLERINFKDYIHAHDKPAKMLWYNFLSGAARGFGMIIGMTIVVAYFWLMIEWLGGIPWIGKIVSDIVDIVKEHQSIP